VTFEVQTNFINFRNARGAHCLSGMVSTQGTAGQLVVCVPGGCQQRRSQGVGSRHRSLQREVSPNLRTLLRQLSAVQEKPRYLWGNWSCYRLCGVSHCLRFESLRSDWALPLAESPH